MNFFHSQPEKMVRAKCILFYNTMWGASLCYPEEEIPESYVLTTDRRFMEEAVAIVFHVPSLSPQLIENMATRRKKDQIWVAWWMECEAHYPHLSSPSFMRCFDLKMSYHPDSDIAVPYVQYGVEASLRRPVPEKNAGKVINAFISSHFDRSGRIAYLRQLMDSLDVHSYGKQLQTRAIKEDKGRSSKMDTISQYKFTVAFENAIWQNYVTEKFYDPLLVGSVPVYLGAPNIDDFAPGDRCFINVSEWSNPKDLAQYLIGLSEDEMAYETFFVWKTKQFKRTFTDLLEGQKEHAFARLCKRVEEML